LVKIAKPYLSYLELLASGAAPDEVKAIFTQCHEAHCDLLPVNPSEFSKQLEADCLQLDKNPELRQFIIGQVGLLNDVEAFFSKRAVPAIPMIKSAREYCSPEIDKLEQLGFCRTSVVAFVSDYVKFLFLRNIDDLREVERLIPLHGRNNDFVMELPTTTKDVPGLLRLVFIVISNLKSVFRWFIADYDSDINFVVGRFSSLEDISLRHPKRIVFIENELHQSGKVHIIIEFTSLTKIVYKKRRNHFLQSVTSNVATPSNEFLTSLINEKTPTSLQIADRCWQMFIGYCPRPNPTIRKNYFFQLGELQFLCELFNASDIHEENIICGSAGPVVVDTETFCQIDRTFHVNGGDHSASDQARQLITNSLCSTGILPVYHKNPNNNQLLIYGVLKGLIDTGSSFDSGYIALQCLPENAREVGSIEAKNDFVEGYMSQLRAASRSINSMAFDPPAAAGSRYIIRPTQLYAMLIDRMLHPTVWRAGSAWRFQSLLLNDLDQGFRRQGDPTLSLTMAERIDIDRFDVPIFEYLSCDNKIHHYSGLKSSKLGPVEFNSRVTDRITTLEKRKQFFRDAVDVLFPVWS
jgi:hypothetical protein